ncbi:S-layer homology domain-containing protein [Paenibacillus sp. GCM10012307]|uniref:S-layer homology domain-containing protein n=1 Tax=Paenibacillus roseus TaxID=2798579 RepID=A0A934MKS3_9BACL|nr:S-layer homology domain-containing protein [Paenibacillus roseus]MBJ6361375.1 S-layer homology domain-containing protein [Paenibacillus roseus]
MIRGKKKSLFIAFATVIALTGTIPQAAFADKAAGSSAVAASGDSKEAQGQEQSESPINAKISKDKADQLSRSILKIPKEYVLQHASYQSNSLYAGKQSNWSLYYTLKKNNKTIGNISTTINSDTGELVSYNASLNDPSRKPSYPPKFNRDKAQEVADSFIQDVGAKYRKDIKFDNDLGTNSRQPLSGEVYYDFRYNRTVDGQPFKDNYIQLTVDGEGHVLNYSVNWDPTIKFQKVVPGLTLEEAVKRFHEEAKPHLSYTIPYNAKNAKDRQPSLAYSLPALTIDAVTGKSVVDGGLPYKRNTTEPVSDKPLGSKPVAGKALTSEQAEKRVRDAFAIAEAAKVTDSSYSEYKDEVTGKTYSTWNIGWSLEKDKKTLYSIQAEVNAQTGEIRSYYQWNNNDKSIDTKGVTYAEAKKTALELVKKQLPGYAHELYLQEQQDLSYYDSKKPSEIGDYSFSFEHQINGAVASYDRVYVNIDANTGEVRNYYYELLDYNYPSKLPAVISQNEVLRAFDDFYKVELTYALIGDNQDIGISDEKKRLMIAAGEISPSQGDGKGTGEAKLIYRMVPKATDEQVFLDAVTGKWRSQSSGDVTDLEQKKATDIDGHWAARELELMVSYKALDLEDGKVRPNQIITRGELIKMLVLSMNGGGGYRPYLAAEKASFSDVSTDSSYFLYVEDALANNLIDRGDGSFNPEGKVDREEMAELIVRALGYNTLADHENLFKINFSDAAKLKKKGQAAIVAGLGIMSADSKGNFKPQGQVSRAEAATAFFRFLQARADLKEAPLRD